MNKEIWGDFTKFKDKLNSQYELYKKELISYPEKELIDKGHQYYAKLDDEEKKMFDELIKAYEKAHEPIIMKTTMDTK